MVVSKGQWLSSQWRHGSLRSPALAGPTSPQSVQNNLDPLHHAVRVAERVTHGGLCRLGPSMVYITVMQFLWEDLSGRALTRQGTQGLPSPIPGKRLRGRSMLQSSTTFCDFYCFHKSLVLLILCYMFISIVLFGRIKEKRERERRSIGCFTPKSPTKGARVRFGELSPDLPRGCRNPITWAMTTVSLGLL